MTNKQLRQLFQILKDELKDQLVQEVKEQIREELKEEILQVVFFIKQQEQKLTGKNIDNVIEQLDKERQSNNNER